MMHFEVKKRWDHKLEEVLSVGVCVCVCKWRERKETERFILFFMLYSYVFEIKKENCKRIAPPTSAFSYDLVFRRLRCVFELSETGMIINNRTTHSQPHLHHNLYS